ncbi:hypothetical protein QQS21_003240 [Conoideocrella luteorostrata]|uniref:Transcription factor domain-containing protein n=1 Tax=Conoideocrella luteorostrata TaxID=1105319 RepID=A0AAJ0CW44_9HYPO|nr:hypothetical protein QQS21_003240 [Conoideocrella luteorostrata]
MSIELLRRLRLTTAVDNSSLLSQFNSLLSDDDGIYAAGVDLPVPTIGTLPARDSSEFRLMARHSFAYPMLSPPFGSTQGMASAFIADMTAQAKSQILQVFLLLCNSKPFDGAVANYFVKDLIDHGDQYCSRLLVSSLLSWACLAYCAVNNETISIGAALFKEANSLWDHEYNFSDSLTTIAAAQFLTLWSIYNDSNDGYSYQKAGIGMAQRMGLFGLEHYSFDSDFSDPESRLNASTYTA